MIKIGVIGTGKYGSLHLTALKDRELVRGDIKLCGLTEINAEVRERKAKELQCRGYADYRQMIEKEKLDAVTIATPDHLHHDVTMACLEYRIPILLEKPFATKVGEAEAMCKKALASNVLLQIDFHKRVDPYHIDLRSRVQRGEFGTLEYGYYWIEDTLNVGTDIIGQKTWGENGSPIWFIGIHAIDLSMWLMDFPAPKEVYAKGFKGKLSSMGLDIYDSIKSTVTYGNGCAITYDTSVILPNNYESQVHQGLKMVGTEGIVELNTQYRGERLCTTRSGMGTPNLGGAHSVRNKNGGTSWHGYLYDAIHDFVDNVSLLKAGKTVRDLEGTYPSAVEALVSTRIGEAIHTSIRENRVISL